LGSRFYEFSRKMNVAPGLQRLKAVALGAADAADAPATGRAQMYTLNAEPKSRAAAQDLFSLSRAMIRQARMLKDAGSAADARQLAGRARALDLLGWSYRDAA
jgi:hypothetical protein